MHDLKKIIISRTDNIGDVVLTLPLAGYLKKALPGIQIYFIGKAYTAPVIISCGFVDVFLEREEVLRSPEMLGDIGANAIIHVFPDRQIARAAYKAGIPLRIGTSHRMHHWLYCNRLVSLSRKNSALHEAMLNFELLKPLQLLEPFSLKQMPEWYGMTRLETLQEDKAALISGSKISVILHPKSKGSAREWPLENYAKLMRMLPETRYDFFITGTLAEGEAIRALQPDLFHQSNIHDMTGRLSLGQLIAFIQACDVLVACSTGPLHLAAALGKLAIGIYPPMRPIHPGRWAPVGRHVAVKVLNKTCNNCQNMLKCACIEAILPGQIADEIRKAHA